MSIPPYAPDDALTIALAEYQQLSDAKRVLYEQSSSRFNFFLAAATAVAAVSAGVFATESVTRAATGSVVALVALLVSMGITTFLRLVEYSVREQQHTAAQTVLRSYLADRAEQLRPYLMSSTITDSGLYSMVALRHQTSRDAIGLHAIVGLINSAVLGLAAGLAVDSIAHGPLPVLAATLAFLIAYGIQLWWIHRSMLQTTARIEQMLEERGLT